MILAAGSSRRLGRTKQLLPLRGAPLVQHVIDAAAGAGVGEIVLVLGHDADRIAAAVRLPANARVVVNPDHETGQASSLRTGIDALSHNVRRAVILLGDQPGVSLHAIAAVAAASEGPIARASYGGRPSHPVAVARELWDELRAIGGDQGARALIAARPALVTHVPIDEAPPDDVDTPADYQRLLR